MTQVPHSRKNQNPCKLTTKRLILLNDDYNTFDHVIDCLVSLCDHETVQAEQCALLTHYTGSCEILVGELEDLKFIKEDLILYGINVEIV
ncbi:MAG: hypothetical protein CMP73_02205 [Flavobacteriales bacterium]|nr:hypothetical protein [Flavobacteriales bacterium]